MTSSSSKAKDYIFAFISVVLGIVTLGDVSGFFIGPTFKPILEACLDKSIPIDEFVARTGYHIYEPKVGLVVFEFPVCLATQYFLELREGYPAGLLAFTLTALVALPIGVSGAIEAGRGGAKGVICYPITIGVIAQLIGISVAYPLLTLPGLILGRGDGVASEFRSKYSFLMAVPYPVLTWIAFTSNTDSYLWTFSTSLFGGPLFGMTPLLFWTDKAPSNPSPELVKASTAAAVKSFKMVIPVTASIWVYLVYVTVSTFGFDIFALWDAVWVNAADSVKFMAVDFAGIYASFMLYSLYLGVDMLLQFLYLTPVMGPGAAGCYVIAQYEENSLAQKLKNAETKSD